MSNFNNTDELKKQYGTSDNLNNRILLHSLFSTNKSGWANWVFKSYRLKPNQRILELGCGNAEIWKAKAEGVPQNTKLILSDFSAGMLKTAKINTNGLDFVEEYALIDAQSIPFDDKAFDIVIANHMLYHVPDVNKALAEISRVLKQGGAFYATATGNRHLKEISDILYDFDNTIDFALDSINKAFGLENGKDLLSRHFNYVKLKRYIDSLHITDPKPFIDYIFSSQGISNVRDIITGEKTERFKCYIADLFSEKGYLDVKKDSGIFISRLCGAG